VLRRQAWYSGWQRTRSKETTVSISQAAFGRSTNQNSNNQTQTRQGLACDEIILLLSRRVHCCAVYRLIYIV